MTSCRAHYVENVESEVLEAVARWSVIGKVVSFLKLRLKLLSEGVCLTKSGVIPDFRGTEGKTFFVRNCCCSMAQITNSD